MPRAGALSPSHCQDMCLDLCMSFGALLAFTWGPEQMWHFLRIRAPALSGGVGLVDNTEGASRLPVLVLLLSRVGPGKAQRTGRGYVGEDEGAGHPPPPRPVQERCRSTECCSGLSVSNTLHLCFCPFMSRTTHNVLRGGASVSQTKSCPRSSSALGEDAASFQPDPYLRTAAPPFSISPNLAIFLDSD